MPASEKFEKKGQQKSGIVKVESFDDDEQKKSGGNQVDLPDLPKI
jgi:hypothetical protein